MNLLRWLTGVEPTPSPPAFADDLPLAADAPTAPVRGPQAQLVAAVLAVLADHDVWLAEHPSHSEASPTERAMVAQRVVFRAVQAGIDTVRPRIAAQAAARATEAAAEHVVVRECAAEAWARARALAEAAVYVAAAHSTDEAAAGLVLHAGRGEVLPVRAERFPGVVQAVRTGQQAAVTAVAQDGQP